MPDIRVSHNSHVGGGGVHVSHGGAARSHVPHGGGSGSIFDSGPSVPRQSPNYSSSYNGGHRAHRPVRSYNGGGLFSSWFYPRRSTVVVGNVYDDPYYYGSSVYTGGGYGRRVAGIGSALAAILLLMLFLALLLTPIAQTVVVTGFATTAAASTGMGFMMSAALGFTLLAGLCASFFAIKYCFGNKANQQGLSEEGGRHKSSLVANTGMSYQSMNAQGLGPKQTEIMQEDNKARVKATVMPGSSIDLLGQKSVAVTVSTSAEETVGQVSSLRR